MNGLNDDSKRRQVCNKLLKDRPDIVVLTDTRLALEKQQDMIKRTDYNCYFADNPRRCKGIAILVKNTTDCKIHKVTPEPNGQLLYIELILEQHPMLIVAAYGPSNGDDDPEWWEDVFGRIFDHDTIWFKFKT